MVCVLSLQQKILSFYYNVFSEVEILYHKALILQRPFFYYMEMIFLNHRQQMAPICMQMTPVFSTNMRTLKNLKYFK